MGKLIEGRWHASALLPKTKSGHFERDSAAFRGRIEKGSNETPERGRYHLFVSHACPWAHRTLIVRALKGLEEEVTVSVVSPLMLEDGWVFDEPDPVTGAEKLYEVYVRADPDYTGKVTVPVLWDKETWRIVNNESSEIIRLLDEAWPKRQPLFPEGLYPQAHRAEIDEVNARVYETVNNGVYRCGFAQSQQAYDEAVGPLFDTLAWLDERLAKRRWLVGDHLSEADIRLFTTLVRFDAVYATHFKCNRRRLIEYPHLFAFARDVYQLPGVKETLHLDHIKDHYYRSHPQLNPSGIVPVGFEVDFAAPVTRPC